MTVRWILRAIIAALLLAALFEPSWKRTSEQVRPTFLIDVSSSVDPDSLAETLAWLRAVDRQSLDAGYVAFADRGRAVSSLEELRSLPVVNGPADPARGAISRLHSNLAEGLRIARGELRDGVIGRMVVLSDGRFDDPPEEILVALAELTRSNIRIDAVPLRSALAGPSISSLAVGAKPRARAPLQLDIEVLSAAPQSVLLEVADGGRPLLERDLELEPGSNRLATTVRLQEPGSTELVLSIDGVESWRERIEVGGRPRALLMSAIAGGPLSRSLTTQGWEVRQVRPDFLAPSRQGADQLDGYDAVILSNVSPRLLGPVRMELIRDWVLAGGGLFFASGDQTFGEEGYSQSPLESVLPLRFNVEEERTDVALMIALDKSYSMKGPKIELAKEATKAALGELDERHRFGVVAFDWEPYDVVPLDSVEYRERMLESISRIEASAQTNFYPALESCLRQLSAVDAEVRHVILLSDGKTYPDDYEGLIARMREADITVSTVGVGSEADRDLLADIARWGNGQTYYVQDAKRVQRILLDEARGKLEETLVEEAVRARAVNSSRALVGIEISTAPPLAGHLNLEPRQDSEVVLETDSGKPLLARRNVGLGRSWMFTSDLESRWTADWVRWPGFGALWSQILHDASGRHSEPGLDFQLERRNELLTASLTAIDTEGRTRNGLDVLIRATAGAAADNPTLTAPMRQTGPGIYRGELQLEPVPGSSQAIDLVIQGETRVRRSIYYPQVDELRPGLADQARLEALTETTGGLLGPTLDQIFDSRTDRARWAIPLWPWLIGLALLLYLAELAIRRRGWFAPVAELVALEHGEPRTTPAATPEVPPDGVAASSPSASLIS